MATKISKNNFKLNWMIVTSYS